MIRQRILFVDDEVAVLHGLQNLLRKERKRWDMVFAVGGAEALDALGKQPFDIVISDMRMPGMDGAELLSRVNALYPSTARLILSGHADRQTVMRAAAVSHQFLSKPCDHNVLRVAIERTCGLRSLLADERIRSVVGRLECLPSVPATYCALAAASADPEGGIDTISAIVESDPAMSAKVLQLVNSAYFGHAQRVASIPHAVSYLGVELLKGLALTAQIFSTMAGRPIEGFDLDRLQTYSLLTARVARRLLGDPARAEEAFTAALVHDIGTVIIALGLPAEFTAALRECQRSGRRCHEVERELLGVSHAEVGAYLLGVWGLPMSIVESVAFHHRPSGVTEGPRDVLAAVHVADVLVDRALTPLRTMARAELDLDLEFLSDAGLDGELPRWRELARREVPDAR